MKINPTLCSSARPGSAPSPLLGIPKRLFVPCFSGEMMGWGRSVGEPPWPPQPCRGQSNAASSISTGRLCPSAKRGRRKEVCRSHTSAGGSAEPYSARTKDGGPGWSPPRSPQRQPSRGLPVLKFRVWSKTALQGGEAGTLSTPSARGFSIQLPAASICIRAGPFYPVTMPPRCSQPPSAVEPSLRASFSPLMSISLIAHSL